ncbi:Fatty acid amide hydrolase 1, partial [Neolecta irregularis DAH-3]
MSPFRRAADEKQSQRANAIVLAQNALMEFPQDLDFEKGILSSSAKVIVSKIISHEWTSVNVLCAFARQALKAHEKSNFLTEVFIVEALEEARQLDEEFAKSSKPRGPLHGMYPFDHSHGLGLPVSFKDTFGFHNRDSCVGYSTFTGKPSQEDAALVAIVKRLGGITMYKTNVPQALLAFESGNPIWGTSTNPYNAKFTPGGSSGGEAVALATDSSAIGFGSDIGARRFPSKGHFGIVEGFEAVPIIVGPMARYCEDVQLACEAILDAKPESTDVDCLKMPWNKAAVDELAGKKLTFGYYFDDGYSMTSPACKRAVQETINALSAAGHNVKLFEPPKVNEAIDIFMSLLSADGYAGLRVPLKRDPRQPNIKLALIAPRLPYFILYLLSRIVKYVLKDDSFARIMLLCRTKSVAEFLRWTNKRNLYRELWAAKWNEAGIDGIVCPTMPIPALPHNETANILPVAASTFLYNVL